MTRSIFKGRAIIHKAAEPRLTSTTTSKKTPNFRRPTHQATQLWVGVTVCIHANSQHLSFTTYCLYLGRAYAALQHEPPSHQAVSGQVKLGQDLICGPGHHSNSKRSHELAMRRTRRGQGKVARPCGYPVDWNTSRRSPSVDQNAKLWTAVGSAKDIG